MSGDQKQIYDILKGGGNTFYSAVDISRRLGRQKWFDRDRAWARPILRRMEMEGWLESNEFGEYRLKNRPEDITPFKDALSTPGVSLGDTAIITLADVEEAENQDRKSTRLNSSHQIISYAVFCLKKKKNILKRKNTPKHGRSAQDAQGASRIQTAV